MQKLLSENSIFRVYHVQDDTSGAQSILKVLKSEFASPDEIVHLNNEYEVTRSLPMSFIRKATQRSKIDNCQSLELEYFDGETIFEAFVKRRQALPLILQTAINICGAIGELHQHNIIHKDINSSNILINLSSGDIRLIDFGISSRISLKTSFLGNPERLEGTLAYMSPEQSGRMNRTVDYRSDLYSLGIVLYEVLTAKLPFNAEDPVEMVHSHIAKLPVSPYERNPQITEALSQIVMKLLSKNAEDRYQSAYGLQYDLGLCLQQLKQTESVKVFELGKKDYSGKFTLPQKLYGRQQQVRELLDAYHRICEGASEALLVRGHPGTGKSALVHEVHKLLAEHRGFFVEGKFDQFQRNVPYYAISRAFKELCALLLTEREEELQKWKQIILDAVNGLGAVITAVVPDLELIIGTQPDPPALQVTEAQNRFTYVFRNFIRSVANRNHPFVLFIDDLQWADSGSLNLVQNLVTDHDTEYFLFIGAYRDNEVTIDHPLQTFFEEINKTNAATTAIETRNLDAESVTELLCDSFNDRAENVTPLAQLITEKTQGNAFFVTQFLKSLYEDGMLSFDRTSICWQWDMLRVRQMKVTDNVVDLMAAKLKKLSPETQEVLKLAACIGNRFDLATLSIIYSHSPQQTAHNLWKAIEEGFISPADNAYKLISSGDGSNVNATYLFVHDRIQQAVYTLISDEEKKAVHLKIGRLLLKDIPASNLEERIFDIVYQINFGIQEITGNAEKTEVARLNLEAGKKAKQSSAYKPALAYLNSGLSLLNENSWDLDYELTLALYTEGAEAAYLAGDYDLMEERVSTTLQRSRGKLDKVLAYNIRIDALTSQNRLADALNTGVGALALLGVRFPKNPRLPHIFIALFGTKIKMLGKKFESLPGLPEMKDEYKLRALPIMERLTPAAFMSGSSLFPLIIFKMVNLSVQYGNALPSAFGYASYAITLSGVLGDIESGTRLGNASRKVLEKHFSEKFKVQVLFVNNVFIRHWTEPLRNLTDELVESYHLGLKAGNLVGGIWAAYYALLLEFFACGNLDALSKKLESYTQTFQMLKQDAAYERTQMLRQAIASFIDKDTDPLLLNGVFYNEKQLEIIRAQGSDKTSVFTFYLFKLMIACHYQKFEQAISYWSEIPSYLESVTGLPELTWFIYYDAVAILGFMLQQNKAVDKKLMNRLHADLKKLKKWGKNESPNYACKYYHLVAQHERLKGRQTESRYWFDKAIQSAESNSLFADQALIAKDAAGYCFSLGLDVASEFYLKRCYAAYDRWGSGLLKELLENENPSVLFINSSGAASTTSGSTYSTRQLDVFSVMKASIAISGEIQLDRLLEKLLSVAIENAGAQRGCLFLLEEGAMVLKAEACVQQSQTEFTFPEINLNSSDVARSIVQLVWRSNESIVLANAPQDYRFVADEYMKDVRPKSVMCLPILNLGLLRGILYCENNLVYGAFQPEKIEVLKVLSGQMAVSLENSMLYQSLEQKVAHRTKQLAEQKAKSDELLLNILPAETAEELKISGTAKSRRYQNVTVMFTDFVNFTQASERLSADELVEEINFYYSAFDEIVSRHGIEKIKTIGDSYMCAGGLPAESLTHAEDTIYAALEMRDFIKNSSQQRAQTGKPAFNCRIGIHTGPVVAGIVGTKKFAYDIWGDTVNIASRMESSGEPGKVNISGATYKMVHDKFRCFHRGKIQAKNKGLFDMYFIEEPL